MVNIMSVIATRDNQGLTLRVDNGDFTKMEEAIQRWKFKDEQAF
jgi:hypothetical protein